MIALLLSSRYVYIDSSHSIYRPELGWRDVQQLIIQTAEMTDEKDQDWQKNGAGRMVSPKYGFGKMNAERLVAQGRVHAILPIPALQISVENRVNEAMNYNTENTHYRTEISVSEDAAGRTGLVRLEHVQVTVYITHEERRHLRITLVSPSGTRSLLADIRSKDVSKDGYNPWTFMTVHSWGEAPAGTWSLEISDGRYSGRDVHGHAFAPGTITRWALTLHGTCAASDIVERRDNATGATLGRTCLHSVNERARMQTDLAIGLGILVLCGVLVGIVYAVYRYQRQRGKRYISLVREDIESPARRDFDGESYERIELMNKNRGFTTTPALHKAQEWQRHPPTDYAQDQADYAQDQADNSRSEFDLADADSLKHSTSYFGGGPMLRSSSKQQQLNLFLLESNIQRSASTSKFALESNISRSASVKLVDPSASAQEQSDRKES